MSKALRVTPRALKWSSLYSEIASRSRCGLSVRDQIKRVGRPDGTNYTNSSRLFSTLRSSGSGATSSNPQMNFPCLDHLEKRSQSYESGPEPQYSVPTGYQVFHSTNPLALDYGGILPEFEIAFETWGELNEDKSNAILIHTGLSASSHARSHEKNPAPGWWEKFIGPGLSIDTDKFFVICTNVIGGCFGSTGPSSIDPADGQRYATRFPILSIQDVVRAQHRLITERLSIKKLFASVGSSMGGQQSLAFGCEFPESVDRIVSISGCARSHPYSIAMRHTQRQILMSDPNWKRGFYYDSIPPHSGMKLAREVATITYRSGPEWEMRFGRDRADPSRPPALCPDFLIETYLDHQGEKWCFEYDPNSFLYLSKAMDLFDLGVISRKDIHDNFSTPERKATTQANECALPKTPYNEQPRSKVTSLTISDLIDGMLPLADHKVLVIGVESDLLFPAWQQREIAKVIELVQENNSEGSVEYIELSHKTSMYGHDTFLLDLKNVGGPIKKFLEA